MMEDGTSAAAAHDQDGPIVAAFSYMRAVLIDGDYRSAWSQSTPNLRLVRAQAWLWANRDYFGDDVEVLAILAADLATSPSASPHWAELAASEVTLMRSVWDPEDYHRVSVSTVTRAVDLARELVLLVDPIDLAALQGATTLPDGSVSLPGNDGGVRVPTFAALLLEYDHVDRVWLMAGHTGEQMLTPGWPPTVGPAPC